MSSRRNRPPRGANASQQDPAAASAAAATASGASPANAESNSSDFQTEDDEDYSWISYFLTLKGNEFFCQVDEDYINDGFNLMGLSSQVPYYEFALDIVLDADYDDDHLTEEQLEMIESEAENLYGLIHSRYIRTNRGLHAMLEKYRNYQFGRCPRVFCHGQPLLPCGLCDTPGKAPVKLFCAKCNDAYNARSVRAEKLDGAYFGTTFPHLFFLVYPELKPQPPTESYVPRVFGYELHPSWHDRSLRARNSSDKLAAPAADRDPSGK